MPSITSHIPDFLEYCEVEKGLAALTVKNYDCFLRVFTGWLAKQGRGDLKPSELTPDQVWNYRLYLSRKKIKKTTQSYYLIALRNLLEFFDTRTIRSLAPHKVQLPKITAGDKAIKFLNYQQVEKLLAMPDTATLGGLRDRAILEVLFSTGMRVSELVALDVKLFDVAKLTREAPQEILEMSIVGKGGSIRTIYFSTRALNWIGKYLAERGLDMFPGLFLSLQRNQARDSDHRLTIGSIEKLVRTYTAMAGLPVQATPHTLRHSFATDILGAGADIRSVQEALGHKSIATTQIYTHLTNKQLKESFTKFHSGNR